MNLIIAGGREFTNYGLLKAKLDFYLKKVDRSTLTLLCGGARGADSLGEKYFKEIGLGEQIKYFIPDWDDITKPDAVIRRNKKGYLYNAKAGNDRNEEMAREGTHLVAFWDGITKGTKDMIKRAQEYKLLVRVVNY